MLSFTLQRVNKEFELLDLSLKPSNDDIFGIRGCLKLFRQIFLRSQRNLELLDQAASLRSFGLKLATNLNLKFNALACSCRCPQLASW